MYRNVVVVGYMPYLALVHLQPSVHVLDYIRYTPTLKQQTLFATAFW